MVSTRLRISSASERCSARRVGIGPSFCFERPKPGGPRPTLRAINALAADPGFAHGQRIVEHDEIGRASSRNSAMTRAESEEVGRVGRSHSQRLLRRNAGLFDRVAYGRGHVEARTGKRALRIDATSIAARDRFAVEFERIVGGSYWRHRVGHEKQFSLRLRGKGNAQDRRVQVIAIDDQSAPARRIFERGADDTRLAAQQWRHRVEQVREATHAGVQRAPRRRVVRCRVSTRDDDSARNEGADRFGRNTLRRERDQRASVAQR